MPRKNANVTTYESCDARRPSALLRRVLPPERALRYCRPRTAVVAVVRGMGPKSPGARTGTVCLTALAALVSRPQVVQCGKSATVPCHVGVVISRLFGSSSLREDLLHLVFIWPVNTKHSGEARLWQAHFHAQDDCIKTTTETIVCSADSDFSDAFPPPIHRLIHRTRRSRPTHGSVTTWITAGLDVIGPRWTGTRRGASSARLDHRSSLPLRLTGPVFGQERLTTTAIGLPTADPASATVMTSTPERCVLLRTQEMHDISRTIYRRLRRDFAPRCCFGS